MQEAEALQQEIRRQWNEWGTRVAELLLHRTCTLRSGRHIGQRALIVATYLSGPEIMLRLRLIASTGRAFVPEHHRADDSRLYPLDQVIVQEPLPAESIIKMEKNSGFTNNGRQKRG